MFLGNCDYNVNHGFFSLQILAFLCSSYFRSTIIEIHLWASVTQLYCPMLPINYVLAPGLLKSIVWFPFQGYALLCVGFPSGDVEVETQDEDEAST